MFDFELPEKLRRYVPLVAWLIVALVVLLIPLKIIGYGYLPGDDALRHCAKAVSGKPWSEILVLKNPHIMSSEFGWQALLGVLHRLIGWNQGSLLIFSVVGLFLIVNGAMLPWLKRPEAWLAVLLAAMLISDLPGRFTLGRPFLLTITSLMSILFATQKLTPGLKSFLLITALLTMCIFFHGVWYLWLLPIAAFFFAGQFAWAFLVFAAWVVSTALAALLTGHPVEYLSQALLMALHAVGEHFTNRTEVTELQPFDGAGFSVILVGALVGLRSLAKLNAPPLARSPAFWIVCGCWMLGFRVSRFWEDWGWPALMVWMASDLQLFLLVKMAADSLRRLLLVLILAVAAFLCVTSDYHTRWTQSLTWQFLSVKEHPKLKGWMPDKGGILYSVDMTIFYQTFFKNPHGDWRYMVGYEPALMPTADFKTFKSILWNNGDVKAYKPWVAKMKPADRLVIRGDGGAPPNIPQLQWYYGVSGIWIGRTPRTNAPAASPPAKSAN